MLITAVIFYLVGMGLYEFGEGKKKDFGIVLLCLSTLMIAMYIFGGSK